MSNSELFTFWFWSLGVAAIIVVIAAALLIAILLVAQSIRENARQALEAAEQIAADTQPIWELDETNRIAEDILATVENIEVRGNQLVETLHEPERIAG